MEREPVESASDSIAVAQNEVAAESGISVRLPSVAVHATLAGCSLVMLAFCLLSSTPGADQTGQPLLITGLVLLGPMLFPAAYWHQHKNADRRDAALMLPWTFIVGALIAQTALTAATYTYPLRDMLWRHLDERLGISLPAIVGFAAGHPVLSNLLGRSYGMVHPMVLCAIFLPALLGRRVAAERFLLANALGFVLALPCMVFLPAVGPWVAGDFAPNHAQFLCGEAIRTLREGAISSTALFGATVCLPSFHVFWGVVSAYALQPFRWLRIPAILLAGLITISTLTTGWHYGVDVIAGIVLAAACIAIASVIVPRCTDS
jgi:hypothetical protein